MTDVEDRPYRSPRREEQARETRNRVLDAARRLFLSRGYAATSIPTIAAEAGVAVPTVYWAFNSKRELLWEMVSRETVGDAEPVPLVERSWWKEMLSEPDVRLQLNQFAGINRQLHERTVDLFEIVRGAATSDPAVAQAQLEGSQRRYQDVEGVAASLATKGGLRSGVTVEQAADLLWAMTDSTWYGLLVRERGWSPEQYEQWEVTTLTGFLLRPDEREASQ